MTHLTGVRRIKLLGLCVAIVGALMALALWMLSTVPYSNIVPMIGFPLFLGGVIYMFGWLVEGFVAPSAKRR